MPDDLPRLSVSVRNVDASTVSTALEWERAGIGGIWCADHLGMHDPFVPLAAIASATTGLRLGTLVINHDFWTAPMLARAAGTLERIAPGRTVLGLGAGHAEVEYAAMGLDYRGPGARVDRLTDLFEVTMRLLAGETVTHESEWCRLHECSLGLATPQRPPRTLVGGNGERVLTLAAQQADIVGYTGFTSGTGQTHSNLSHFTWAGLAQRMALVAERAAGRDVEANVLVQQVAITEDPRGYLSPWAQRAGVLLEDLLDNPFVLVGSTSFVRDQLARLAVHGVDDVCVLDTSVDALLCAISS
jgi:probable F420-dependent oxidoreductase